jgi:hypothetical protein
MSQSSLRYVLDYGAMQRPYRPKCLHREECPHPMSNKIWREARPQELKTLPPCKGCQEKD